MPDTIPTRELALDGRPDRPALIAFLADPQNELPLRDGLSEAVPDTFEIRRGGIAAAITAMRHSATPRVLIVDLADQEHPLAALGSLAEVTEPDVIVLALGPIADLDFYRTLTRGFGVREYLPQPLTRDEVARHFAPVVLGRERGASGVLGGQMITVTGARGGVGASTIALNLAWSFGVLARRHTVLLDPDLHMGLAPFLLDLRPGPGLRLALEAPERIDALLAERIAMPAADRLHVLAAHEPLTTDTGCAPGAAGQLAHALRGRYSYIVVDLPFRPLPLNRELLDAADQRILVMEPTLASIRDVLRLLALPAGAGQARAAIVVLNRSPSIGGMNRRQIEDGIGRSVDVVIPNLPRQLGNAATLGEPALTRHGAFGAALAELARHASPVRLTDGAPAALDAAVRGPGLWRRMLRRPG